ncbi:MAG TPA: methyltransferase domain-containing protein [Dehalococcoidia bacterium]|nr:methyltransferase domain-containing protein [Dehalococcoidia bacterium]
MTSMDILEEAKAKACCADLYQSELARMIMGDSIHPGGLTLTNQMGRLMGIQPGDWVADLASARGNSAVAVSRVFKCNVVGVEFGREAALESHTAAINARLAERSHNVQGDAETPPLRAGRFDSAFCECAMSLFQNKARAVAETVNLLKPGGRFGLSDVTVEPNCLPPEIDGTLGQLLCLTDASTVQGYVELMEASGLKMLHQVDASIEGIKILAALEAKLEAFTAWQKMTGQQGPDPEMLERGPELLATLRGLIQEGRLGYWIFVAEKPTT